MAKVVAVVVVVKPVMVVELKEQSPQMRVSSIPLLQRSRQAGLDLSHVRLRLCVHPSHTDHSPHGLTHCGGVAGNRWLYTYARGFPTRMVHLRYMSCLRYTILVRNPRFLLLYYTQTQVKREGAHERPCKYAHTHTN